MENTLPNRLKKAMAGPPKVTGAELARACGISRPSVSGWLTGESKGMSGENLLATARRLGVRPEWLANGVGPMRDENTLAALAEPAPPQYKVLSVNRAKAQSLVLALPESELPEALFALEYIAARAKKISAKPAEVIPFPVQSWERPESRAGIQPPTQPSKGNVYELRRKQPDDRRTH